MAKRSSSQNSKAVKRSIHFDDLGNGLLDAFSTVRKTTYSELITSLLVAEFHRAQGTEKEALRAILKHLAIDTPRRSTSPHVTGQGSGADDLPDGLKDRNDRFGEIVEKSHAPIDAALNEVAGEIKPKSSTQMSRFNQNG